MCECVCSVISDSLWPHGLWLARLLCPWDSSSENTVEGCQLLLQGIFLIQGLNLFPESPASVQFSSVAKLCLTLYNPMDCSTSGFHVHHQTLEFAQAHVNQLGDAIQSSYPLSSPFPPAFYLSQHQVFPMKQFFTLGGQSIGVSASASVLPMNIQDWFPFLRKILT